MTADEREQTNTMQQIKEAINQTMPFGKYQGRKLLMLPERYLVWFHAQGFPEGKLGQQLALVYEIKLNGLESTFMPLLDNGLTKLQTR
ncbi:MAG: DUF3820 family protein [Shewanella sp.]|nr:DUF3820 family protein [Shewanella sp.]